MDERPFTQPSDRPAAKIVQALAKIALALRHRAWQRAWPAGLTPTQAQALVTLRDRPQGLRLSALADQLGVTPATASDAVAALARKRLVTKKRAPDDRRAVAVRLTGRGRRLADEAVTWPDVLREAVDELESEEQAAMLRAFIKVIRRMQERGQIPVSRMCVTCRFFRPRVHADPRRPHHCAFVDAPFGDAELRLDCPDHEAEHPDEIERRWARFASAGRPM